MRFLAITLTCAVILTAAGPDPDHLLRPKAIASRTPPATIDQLAEHFADPPWEYRPAPLWVWNDELAWPRLEEQLRQYKEQGFGGVFVHPRPGLITEFMGEEWFDLWKKSLDLGKQLGLGVHIYDENSYPAGFSGGHVPALAPDTAGKVVTFSWRDSISGAPWTGSDTVAIYAAKRGPGDSVASFQRLREGDPLPAGYAALVTRIEKVDPRAWTGGFPYVDLTNPRTTEVFLETTYEAYKERFGGEFGKNLIWAFSDEPELSKKGPGALPLNFRILAEFNRRFGYDLAGHLPSLFWDTGDYRRVRFDYWELLHSLLTESFFEPMFTWCDRNNLQWTGHWWEHNWPYPWLTPSDMSFYAFQHMPGIDVLGFQCFDLDRTGVQPHILFTIKQVSSTANQLGRPRVLSETYGGYGWRATFEQFKRMGDWEIVHGVNLVNQHLSYVTTRGARKRDWPQSFSDAAAWWPYYRSHNDHTARLSLAMSAGRQRNRVLVLNPSTSGYLLAGRAIANNAGLEEMKTDQGALVQWLADHQVDFDLGDEYLLEWFGGVEGGRLKIGVQVYDVVVWPRHMKNVRAETAALIARYAAAGGKLVALGKPATYVGGRPDDRVQRLTGDNWIEVSSLGEMLGQIRRLAPPRVTFDRELPAGVALAIRDLDDGGRLLLLNNAGPETVSAVAVTAGAAVRRWDTTTGQTASHPAASASGEVRFPVELPPAGSLVFTVHDSGAVTPTTPRSETITEVAAGDWRVRAEKPNVLVIDFCDLTLNGETYRDVVAPQASKLAFRGHGFAGDVWDSAVQYRKDILDRNRFDDDSGFTATFRFQAAHVPDDLALAVEAPEYYSIFVNGRPVDFSQAERWLDPHLRRAPIAALVRRGENAIAVTGKPFDVRMNIDSVYLLGDFALWPRKKGFELTESRPLRFGPWVQQGRPFDGATAVYSTAIKIPHAGRLRVQLGRWSGSVAEVLLDKKRAAVLGWPPYEAEIPVAPGPHELAIRVVGTPRNVFGPFHDPRPCCDRVLWPGHWSLYAHIEPPSGSAYELADYGLMEPPALELVR